MRFSRWLVAATLAGSLGCAPEQKAPAPPPPPKVLVAPVQARSVELVQEAVGQVDGYVNAEMRARVRGFLQSQAYRDGAPVKAGQLLFTIDPSEYRAAFESAQGQLGRARAALALSQAQYTRSEALLKSGTVTQQAYDDAAAKLADARGQERAAQAAVRQAELNLSYTQVRSPIDGVAGLASVRVGNLVGADGPTLLTTVSQLDPVRVRFPVSERDYLASAGRFRDQGVRDLAWAKAQFARLEQEEGRGEGLELVLADGNVYPRRGVIVATDREINPSTGTIEVEALFPNPDGLLRPGQYGRVRMKRAHGGGDEIVVAQRALLEVQGTFSVAVVGEGNKVELRRVDVGPSTGDERVISKGLTKGERIVIEGVQKVSDGAQVVPENAPQSTAAVRDGQAEARAN